MEKITSTEAIELLAHGDILELGRKANQVRKEKNPGNYVSFIIDRNINYTNICISECKFCAFYRKPGQAGTYLLSDEEILEKVRQTEQAGGTQVMLQGGLHPELDIDYYTHLLELIKKNSAVTIHSFSPTEIVHIASASGLSIHETLVRLKEAGLDSLPGGGAEILDDEVRLRVSPNKITSQQWLEVMRTAHQIGMKSTATMVIGFGEENRHRVHHWEVLRQLQEETGGFRAFIMWSYQPGNTELGGRKTSAWDYLRTLATSRLYLDNFQHVQGSWVTQGQQIGQLTLAFGADDLGSIMLEENVVRAAGTSYEMSVNHMVRIISAAGKIPAQRDTEYNIIKYFHPNEESRR